MTLSGMRSLFRVAASGGIVGTFVFAGTPAFAASGMPQFDFSTFPPQIAWLVVTFVILYLLMAGIGLPRVGRVLAARRKKIADDLDRAEELKKEAEHLLAAYHKAIEKARAEAHAVGAEVRERVNQELARSRAELAADLAARTKAVEAEVQAAKTAAMARVEEVAAEAAAAVLHRLLGASTPPQAVKAAVMAAAERR
jgi:F-type H+-transporting ATPase subunit b